MTHTTPFLKIYMVAKYPIDETDHMVIHGFYDNETLAELAAMKLNENSAIHPYDVYPHDLILRDHNIYRKQCPSSNAAREDS